MNLYLRASRMWRRRRGSGRPGGARKHAAHQSWGGCRWGYWRRGRLLARRVGDVINGVTGPGACPAKVTVNPLLDRHAKETSKQDANRVVDANRTQTKFLHILSEFFRREIESVHVDGTAEQALEEDDWEHDPDTRHEIEESSCPENDQVSTLPTGNEPEEFYAKKD